MLDIQERKKESLGLLDAIIGLLEDFKEQASKQKDSSLSAGVTNNDAFAYLFDILKAFDGTTNAALEFVVKFVELFIPVAEVAVKAMLLANIKTEIGCGSDPTIPNYMREWYYDSEYALYRNLHWNAKIDSNWTDTSVMLMTGIKKGDGVKINIGTMDFLDKLKYNPCADGGDLLYFGIKPKQSPYSLCRADDMDAFIWFVMNKAKFYAAYQIENLSSLKEHLNANNITHVNNGIAISPEKDYQEDLVFPVPTERYFSLFDFFYANNFIDTLKNVACGTAIKYKDSNSISICTKIRDCDGKTEYAQFFPCSDTYQGAMWYVDSFCYSGKDLIWYRKSSDAIASHDALYGDTEGIDSESDIEQEEEDKNAKYCHPRDYEKEFPIFKLEYDGMTSGPQHTASLKGYDTTVYGSATSRNTSNMVFKILPKPFIHYPVFGVKYNTPDGDKKFNQVFLYKKILFNSKGEPDKKGHYSVYVNPSYTSTYIRTIEIKTDTGTGVEYIDTSIKTNYEVGLDKDGNPCVQYPLLTGKQFNRVLANPNVNPADEFSAWLYIYKDGSYKIHCPVDGQGNSHLPNEFLYPCYAPNTIYQFNYQYVMGLQLFDAKQIIVNALMFTLGLNATVALGLTEKQGLDRQRIIEIVKSMCEVDSSSISDCFYSFSNDKYDAMLNKADELRHNGYKFNGSDNLTKNLDLSNVKSILEEYETSTSLNERMNTLKRAITEASVSITVTPETADRVDITTGINAEFLRSLIQNLVISMISALITPKVIILFTINQKLMGNYDEYRSVDDFLRANEQIIIGLVKKIRDLVLEELIAFVLDKLKLLISLWSTHLIMEYYEKIKTIIKLMKEDWLLCIPSWSKQRVLDTDIPIVNYADIDNTQVPITEKCD